MVAESNSESSGLISGSTCSATDGRSFFPAFFNVVAHRCSTGSHNGFALFRLLAFEGLVYLYALCLSAGCSDQIGTQMCVAEEIQLWGMRSNIKDNHCLYWKEESCVGKRKLSIIAAVVLV